MMACDPPMSIVCKVYRLGTFEMMPVKVSLYSGDCNDPSAGLRSDINLYGDPETLRRFFRPAKGDGAQRVRVTFEILEDTE